MDNRTEELLQAKRKAAIAAALEEYFRTQCNKTNSQTTPKYKRPERRNTV